MLFDYPAIIQTAIDRWGTCTISENITTSLIGRFGRLWMSTRVNFRGRQIRRLADAFVSSGKPC